MSDTVENEKKHELFPEPTDKDLTTLENAAMRSIFDDLEDAFLMTDSCISQMSETHRAVYAKFRKQADDFYHDMLLASGDKNEIKRRLGMSL